MIVRMRRWGFVNLLCLLAAVTLVLPQAGGVRAWSPMNTAICTASGAQDDPQITFDGSGGRSMAALATMLTMAAMAQFRRARLILS